MSAARTLYVPWLALLGAGVLAGLVTAFKVFTQGHYLFNANDILLWTLPLGSYVFFALTSTGLSLVASLPLVFDIKRYEPLAKRLVFLSIATLAAAFISIGLELGSLAHMVYIVFSPNLASPIWYMGALYSLELVFLIIKFAKMHAGDWHSPSSRFLGVASMLCGLFAALMLGSVFGLTEARPTYFGPFISVFCLVVAVLSGLAAIILYEIVRKAVVGDGSEAIDEALDGLSRQFALVVGLTLLFYVLKTALESSYTIPDFATSINFGLVVFLLVPYALMLPKGLRRTTWVRATATAVTLAGLFAVHMQILIGGQDRPVGPKAEGLPQVLPYSPSLWEVLVVVCAVSVMLLLYTYGERRLKLGALPD